MPMPFTYRHATDEWRRYLKNMRERTLLDSDNVIYTATDGIFRAFRSRVPPEQVLAFGDELPAVMRSILIWRWDITATLKPWLPRAEIEREILTLRQDHNFASAGILDDLVWGIRKEVREIDFDRVLSRMSPEAQALWAPVGG
ncbi:DUF2267 domain-containing protein [Paracoccus aurantiacus]|uniref:DUF2267 domain-containing protein n=1 Tax=Paracoccus aurantiacus TaxID=2599412 RepID=A0A5C6RZM4_9RHOB|nr:DUF2267 domain-containing protein [Paracoccus aurantiacus]TXB68046.1 DUF2267 domain-containing protein [Paracoccus aurantiacus]